MIVVSRDVFCDLCGNWTEGKTNRSISEAREAARLEGWVYAKGVDGRMHDVCPGCVNKILRPPPATHAKA